MKYIFLAIYLTACSSKTYSFDTVEEARGTARDNSLFNAQAFRQSSPDFNNPAWDIQARGDSSQTEKCPQGDG